MRLCLMVWNWEKSDWPHFTYDVEQLVALDKELIHKAGILVGSLQHVGDHEKEMLTVQVMTSESLKTSEIEGEYLDRESVQSSIRQNLGLTEEKARIPPAETGIAKLTVDLFRNFANPLSHDTLFKWHDTLFKWHDMITSGREDLEQRGAYRTSTTPMRVISGPAYQPKIHFEAPPSSRVPQEMEQFVEWFNESASLPICVRAGIAHLYFVSIHPFEDGNGRVARALAEKALSESLGRPILLLLSSVIAQKRKAYYAALSQANQSNEISDWLVYFATTIMEAQDHTIEWIYFLIEKAKFYDRAKGQLNSRQEKVIARLFRAGPEGFIGGLSAKDYVSITRCSRATASRDLTDLVSKGLLSRTGERRGTRYWLALKVRH